MIDDDKKYLQLLELVLAKKNRFQIRTYNDGYTAMKEFNTYKPDIVILDNDMPHIKGIDLVKSLHTNKTIEMKNTSIIVITSNFHVIPLFKKLGIEYFLPKPFSVVELSQFFNKYIN